MNNIGPLKKYGYLWVTLVLFFGSLIGHWSAAWYSYQEEEQTHNQPVITKDFVVQATRDTLENWQSEFLQLMWQVAGLAYLLHIGSPQSKEGDDRKEAKLDAILKAVDKENGEKLVKKLDKEFLRT